MREMRQTQDITSLELGRISPKDFDSVLLCLAGMNQRSFESKDALNCYFESSLYQPYQQILALDAFADLHKDLADCA